MIVFSPWFGKFLPLHLICHRLFMVLLWFGNLYKGVMPAVFVNVNIPVKGSIHIGE